jgi:hypothetical protein
MKEEKMLKLVPIGHEAGITYRIAKGSLVQDLPGDLLKILHHSGLRVFVQPESAYL